MTMVTCHRHPTCSGSTIGEGVPNADRDVGSFNSHRARAIIDVLTTTRTERLAVVELKGRPRTLTCPYKAWTIGRASNGIIRAANFLASDILKDAS
jgi:hypothetical protein